MANRYLVSSGLSTNNAIYDGGTPLATGDVLRLNGFVWTVAANITIAEVRCDALAPAVASNASRQVLIANGVTLTCTTTVQGIVAATEGMIGCATGGATGMVVSPLFVRGISGAAATETLNIIGNGDTTGTTANQAMIRGAGTVNWTGNIVNPANYIKDDNSGGTLNHTGNTVQNGGTGIWARGSATLTVVGSITNTNSPYYDTTTTTYPAFTHTGALIAGSVPVIRSRSPYKGTGPFINNGAVCAFAGDSLQLMGTNNYMEVQTTTPSTVRLYRAGTLTGFPPENKVENGEVYGPSSEFTGTLDPVTISTGQIADLANALGLHLTPQVLAAITS